MDMNQNNILCDGNQVTGVIDFGHAMHSHIISEVAIAIYYLGYSQQDFFSHGPLLLRQFHEAHPLTKEEIRMLFYKIGLRSCQCRVNLAVKMLKFPESEYLLWNEPFHKSTLRKLYSIQPKDGEKRIRDILDS